MTKDEALKKAFKQAFQLGQDYWYQADHEYVSQNKKSDVTREKFEQLMEDAIKEALANPEPWEKFCDSNCVWTDHHPDCKLAQQEPVAYLCENAVGHKYFRWKKPSSIYKPIALYTRGQA